jgi:tetratricopeptide (TPR) repeat protein
MKLKHRLFTAALLTILPICLFSFGVGQTQKTYSDAEINRSETLFKAGNDLMEQNKYAEALIKYKEGLAITPDALGMLYNGGIAAFSTDDFALALDWWKRLKAGDPDDMQARAKLIQTYQAMGRSAERDTERKELFQVRNSGKGRELFDTDYYVREQGSLGGRRVMVFEYFELRGDRALRYVFYVLDDAGKTEFRISLGSYEMTNSIWRETAKPKAGERLFHMDGYYNWGHATYGMYTTEPTYDETREIVKAVLEKAKKPVSSSTIVNPKP